MQIDSKVVEGLFPKYRSLFEKEVERPNEQLEYFIKEQLPELVRILQNLESTFTKLLHNHSVLILKKQPTDTLFQSFLRKVSEKLQKFFNGLEDYVNKSPEEFEMFEFGRVRQEIRRQMEPLAEVVNRKLPQRGKVSGLERAKQEEIVQSLYMLVEYYQWTKADSTSIGAKFRVNPSAVLEEIRNGLTVGDPLSLVALEGSFRDVVTEYVNKKCRPFLQKRDFMVGKIKEICRETDSRISSSNPKQYMRAILVREHARCDRDIINAIQQSIRQNPAPRQYEKEIPEINQQMTQVQNDFHRLKNNSYYLDIIRGTFIDTYQMETKKLENVFAMGRLEKYLQEVYALVEQMKNLLNRIVDNRKGEKEELQYLIEKIVDSAVRELEANWKSGTPLKDLVAEEMNRVQQLLDTAPDNDDTHASNTAAEKYREQQQTRERERQARIAAERERRQEQERLRKEELQTRGDREKQSRQEKRIKDEERKIKQQEEKARRDELRKLEETDRVRRLEAERLEKEQKRRIEGEQLKIKQEEDRQRRQRQTEQRERKMEQTRQRQAIQEKKRKEEDELKKRKLQDDKKAAEETKKREQQQLEQRKKREQEEKARLLEEEKQKKLQKDRLEKQKQKQLEQDKKKEEQRKKEQQAEKARKAQEEKRLRQNKLQQEKQRQEEKRKAELVRIQKEKEEAAKKEQERIEKQGQEKKKREQEKRQRQERQRQEKARILREKQQAQAKQKERKEREAGEKKKLDQEKRERQERAEAERKQKELEAEKKRKQQQAQREREKQERVRLQNERLQRERKEQQKRKEQERAREEEKRERERLNREKKEQEQREQQRRQKERLDAQRKEKQRKEEEAKRKKQQQELKQSITKPLTGKDSKKQPKTSAIDYANAYDDDEEVLDEDEINPMKKPPSKPIEKNKQPAKKDNDFDFLNDDIDFGMEDSPKKPSPARNQPVISPKDDYADDFEPVDEPEESQGQSNVDTKELMSSENVKLFNDYLKGTQYARKNKTNLEPFNNFEHFIALFEEFVQNREMYFVDPALVQEIFLLPEEMDDPAQYEGHANQVLQALAHGYQSNLQQVEFDLETRYFFPINFKNPLNCRIIQFCPIVKDFVLFLDAPLDPAEEIQEFLYRLTDCFCELFGVPPTEENGEEVPPQLQTILLSAENQAVLNTFDNLLPNLLILFNYLYEYKNRSALVIDQYTIDRFFYTSHCLDAIYKIIEGEEEKLAEHYEKLQAKFESDKVVKTIPREYDLADQHFIQKMMTQFKGDKDAFIKGAVPTVLGCISFEQSEEQFMVRRCIYWEMTKNQPKPILNLYLFESDQESSGFNQGIFSKLMSEEDPRFEMGVYLDFTRHNGLYEYNSFSLPLWAHVMNKKKFKPSEALAVMNFSMLPILACYRNQD